MLSWEKVKHKAEGVILQQKVKFSSVTGTTAMSPLHLGTEGDLKKSWVLSLILMKWLLLHLSALVDGKLLLNCQSESMNVLSISIYSSIKIILLPPSIFIYV